MDWKEALVELLKELTALVRVARQQVEQGDETPQERAAGKALGRREIAAR